MTHLKRLSVAAVMAATVSLAASSPSLAAGRGPGWCTPSSESAVGAAGPAMNGGQLAAGVGQCRRLGSYHHTYSYRSPGYAYGYAEPGWGAPVDEPDYW
ncbi:hypothetical protein JJE66_04665 [Bradyrhizobium diazoefficiens]|uniref:hypothetical protein n=1 Tax=Bradyrhizobium diazoefficiens TaxID=1355477 RepID=UPI00190B5E98|nr:hypothetical protein [Bradyrhizobium diazoefficiens]MBK3660543.1 hypothetical protein [Bradyrhizobium diazoefficiens]